MEKEHDLSLESIEQLAKIVIDFLSESVPEDELPTADAIMVFGHYDPRPALQAAKLWKAGKAPVIILSGKGRDKIPSGFESEADFYASIIEKEGVPRSALILEKGSTNTLENVLFTMQACSANYINPKSLILCSLPPLLRRSGATFKKQFPSVSTYGSAFFMEPNEFFGKPRLSRIIGEFDRLRDYAKKGDVETVVIPESVSRAVEKIRERLKSNT